MSITADQLREEVRAGALVSDEALTAKIAAAQKVLDKYIGDPTDLPEPIPPEVYDRAHLLTAVEMYHQDKAPNGVLNQQYDLGDGTISSAPIRIGSDPLRGARGVLAPWVSGEFFCT